MPFTMTAQFQRVVLMLKRILYAKSGEPYRFGDRILRFTPGSRPVRTKYKSSLNSVVRGDAFQVELILKSLCRGDTAVDIGAHVGQYRHLNVGSLWRWRRSNLL